MSSNKSKNLNPSKKGNPSFASSGSAVKTLRANIRPTRKQITNQRGKNELVCIAPDTNIIVNLARFISGQRPLTHKDRAALEKLLSQNAFLANGTLNEKGKIVMFALPTVMEELSAIAELDDSLKTALEELIPSRVLPLEISQNMQADFDSKTKPLAQIYKKYGLFLEEDGTISMDGKIAIEGGFFNLTVVTQDKHFGAKSQVVSQKILTSNHTLYGKHEGLLATPTSLQDFVSAYSRRARFAQPENFDHLTKTSKNLLSPITQPQQRERRPIKSPARTR